jgi:hypothetical protein
VKQRETPPLKADAAYIAAFGQIMKRIQHVVAKHPGKAIRVCVAGGAAVHLYTGGRVSKDIDAKVMARFLPPDNLEVTYRGKDGHARLLYFDTQYNDTYALLHEDAYDDSLPITVPGVDPARLDVRLLSPLDLAVSKLSRYETHDQEDIRALAQAGLVDAAALRRRAEEALPSYVGDVKRVKTSIALAEKLVRGSAGQ